MADVREAIYNTARAFSPRPSGVLGVRSNTMDEKGAVGVDVLAVPVVLKRGGKRVRRQPVPLAELPPDLWTVENVAAFLGKSRDWVYEKTASGLLPVRKVGGANRYLPTDIATWLKAQ